MRYFVYSCRYSAVIALLSLSLHLKISVLVKNLAFCGRRTGQPSMGKQWSAIGGKYVTFRSPLSIPYLPVVRCLLFGNKPFSGIVNFPHCTGWRAHLFYGNAQMREAFPSFIKLALSWMHRDHIAIQEGFEICWLLIDLPSLLP